MVLWSNIGIQFLNKQGVLQSIHCWFNYGNDNLKFRIESHVKIEKHTTNSRLSSRQQLLFSSSSIENNDYFADLTVAITKLEARQLVVDADSVLNNVKISLPNQVYREKWQQIVDKNPDLQVVLNNTLFASVPIVSVDVERFFCGISSIMSPQRHVLSIELLKQHLLLYWNDF